ncbi:MAG: ATP phosphoribosyltransferase regulatory subunit [Candidatus Kaiserbacteria bacterium]|nr:ATP phosphoribosyltransferase regulatory subunit [Candidatus Kaiserbacteria bacterium]
MSVKSALDKLLASLGLGNVVEILSSNAISWGELQTLLLYIFEVKASKITPVDIMRNYENNRLSVIAEVDPRDLLELDRALYDKLPRIFSAVELAPVSTLGANAALTALDPKVSLSTIRNVEVLGDSGMALGIECAHRRKTARITKESDETHLAASHRLLRIQDIPKQGGLTSHFRAFALASAARDVAGFNKFELSSLYLHIATWLEFLKWSSDHGFDVKNVSVAISDIRILKHLISTGQIDQDEVVRRTKDSSFKPFTTYSIKLPSEIAHASDIPITYPALESCIREMENAEREMVDLLRNKYPEVRFYFDLERCSGIGYYSGICYKITAQKTTGDRYSLAGGGSCDWTKKLLQSKRERLITSGFGTEFFLKKFGSGI